MRVRSSSVRSMKNVSSHGAHGGHGEDILHFVLRELRVLRANLTEFKHSLTMSIVRSLVILTFFVMGSGTVKGADNMAPEGFTALFNGTDLKNWVVPEGDNGHWKVAAGVIDYDGKTEAKKDKDLWSEKEYGDMTLQVDWRWSGKPYKIKHPLVQPDGTYKKDDKGAVIQEEIDEAGDSGVLLRGNSKSQVNFWCWNCGSGEVYGYRTDPKMSAEVIAGVTPKKKMDKPYGEWNHTEITIKGDRLTVKVNGEEVLTNAQLPGVPAKGKLALQHHNSPIQFKNIYIVELK
jgi:hypothetical protein